MDGKSLINKAQGKTRTKDQDVKKVLKYHIKSNTRPKTTQFHDGQGDIRVKIEWNSENFYILDKFVDQNFYSALFLRQKMAILKMKNDLKTLEERQFLFKNLLRQRFIPIHILISKNVKTYYK